MEPAYQDHSGHAIFTPIAIVGLHHVYPRALWYARSSALSIAVGYHYQHHVDLSRGAKGGGVAGGDRSAAGPDTRA